VQLWSSTGYTSNWRCFAPGVRQNVLRFSRRVFFLRVHEIQHICYLLLILKISIMIFAIERVNYLCIFPVEPSHRILSKLCP